MYIHAPLPGRTSDATRASQSQQVRLEGSYLVQALEVTGPAPNDRRPIPLSLRPPTSASSWELLLAYSPLPPTLLLVAAGVVVLLLGLLLVALGGAAGMGGKDD